MITQHIVDLLYSHECVIVPGLGGFIKAHKAARIVHTTHEFYPPSAEIAFNAGLCGNDGQLANHIATSKHIPYRDAMNQIKQWVENCIGSLRSGDKFTIEGLGDLFIDSSDKIEFSPSMTINFDEDSFGLSVFFANPIAPAIAEVSEVPASKNYFKNIRLGHLIPETLKWAAVLAPFAAFAVWGTLNGNIIDNYVHSYTGMYSWMRATPGKTIPADIKIQPKAAKPKVETVETPSGLAIDQNTTFEPACISYGELAKNNLTITETPTATAAPATPVAPPAETVETKASGHQAYYIISGAFRDHENANKHINMLREKGYTGMVVDTTPKGLFMVSLGSFNSHDEAASQLSKIKNAGYNSYWIYKKKSRS